MDANAVGLSSTGAAMRTVASMTVAACCLCVGTAVRPRCHDNADWCPTLFPGQCYNQAVEQVCCGTCSRHLISSKPRESLLHSITLYRYTSGAARGKVVVVVVQYFLICYHYSYSTIAAPFPSPFLATIYNIYILGQLSLASLRGRLIEYQLRLG